MSRRTVISFCVLVALSLLIIVASMIWGLVAK